MAKNCWGGTTMAFGGRTLGTSFAFSHSQKGRGTSPRNEISECKVSLRSLSGLHSEKPVSRFEGPRVPRDDNRDHFPQGYPDSAMIQIVLDNKPARLILTPGSSSGGKCYLTPFGLRFKGLFYAAIPSRVS